MSTRTYLLAGLGAALATSVLLNVYQALHGSDAPETPTATPTASAPLGTDTCKAELEHCRQENWSVALRAMTGARPDAGAAPAIPTPAPTPTAPPPPTPGPAAKTGPVEQDDALTQMAREQVRLQWRASKGAIVPYLLRDLADPTKQETWARLETQSMVNSANMTANQRERLEREYAPIRAANTAALKDALSAQPPDAAAAVAATKALYASEDALMGRIAGDEAREHWRAETMHRRTALVAVFAALGDQQWDKNLAW